MADTVSALSRTPPTHSNGGRTPGDSPGFRELAHLRKRSPAATAIEMFPVSRPV
ncbi:hypothetical protein [Rhodococcus opacus]|uniref:hypothetical protein n=1 Tax=Rhodococcus opacus TaxID=37919 RepID=UPI0029534E13|nr:hypothetical protein [Rhodococcus opacus]